METAFENRYEITKEMFCGWALDPINKKQLNSLRTTWWFVFGIASAAAVLSLITRSWLYAVVFAAGVIYSSYMLFFKVRVYAGKQYNAVLKSLKSDKWNRRVVFSDKIYAFDNEGRTVYDFDSIVGLHETDELFILLLGQSFGIRLYKSCFIKGDPEEFAAYIKEKCDI